MASGLQPPSDGWYLPVAEHLKEAYLQYAFTFGAVQEVEFLVEELGASTGMRLLDVGCGPGRHAIELARRGFEVVGIDLSPDFLTVARRRSREAGVSLSLFEMDAAAMPFEEEFDLAISICEGAFGMGTSDLTVLRAMRRALRPGGRLAVGAPNVFHILERLRTGKGGPSRSSERAFDPVTMIYQESVEVIGADGSTKTFEMWSSCYTPRELEWIANGAGLDPEAVYGIAPGDYTRAAPSFDHPELLLIAKRP
jgi:SAM-dependent methyltransferase